MRFAAAVAIQSAGWRKWPRPSTSTAVSKREKGVSDDMA